MALETGDPRPPLSLINGKVHEGTHKHCTEARERKAHAKESVEAGRTFVQAYVPYVHFVERFCADGGMRYVREESDYFRALFGPALLDRIR